jgi:uncharacterized protein YPO0396
VQQDQFEAAVSEIERTFRPQVVRILHTLGNDSTGEPAVFFLILLSDETASHRDRLWSVTNRISMEIEQRIEPLDQWGVLPYFSFRSQFEHMQMNEPAWA